MAEKTNNSRNHPPDVQNLAKTMQSVMASMQDSSNTRLLYAEGFAGNDDAQMMEYGLCIRWVIAQIYK